MLKRPLLTAQHHDWRRDCLCYSAAQSAVNEFETKSDRAQLCVFSWCAAALECETIEAIKTTNNKKKKLLINAKATELFNSQKNNKNKKHIRISHIIWQFIALARPAAALIQLNDRSEYTKTNPPPPSTTSCRDLYCRRGRCFESPAPQAVKAKRTVYHNNR